MIGDVVEPCEGDFGCADILAACRTDGMELVTRGCVTIGTVVDESLFANKVGIGGMIGVVEDAATGVDVAAVEVEFAVGAVPPPPTPLAADGVNDCRSVSQLCPDAATTA